jgi:hypothetical protein
MLKHNQRKGGGGTAISVLCCSSLSLVFQHAPAHTPHHPVPPLHIPSLSSTSSFNPLSSLSSTLQGLTPSEQRAANTLYPLLLPHLGSYVRGLLKLLLVAAPGVQFRDHLIDVRYEIMLEIDGLVPLSHTTHYSAPSFFSSQSWVALCVTMLCCATASVA